MFRKRHVLDITVLLVLLSLGACQPADTPISEADSGQEFVDTVWACEEAFQAGDVDRIIEFYAPDAVSLPPGYPPSVGKEAIEADLRYFFDEFALEREFELVDYEVKGNYATRLGEWTQTLTPKAGGDPVGATGKVTSWAGWTRTPTPGAAGKVTSWAGWTRMPTPEPEADSIVESGRCMLGWRKINGEWKVAWEIWNTF